MWVRGGDVGTQDIFWWASRRPKGARLGDEEARRKTVIPYIRSQLFLAQGFAP